jgi:indolepyruvate ferredoxin oxidoreductase beta subunit
MIEEFNIILAGVGGQGTLLASNILGTAAIMAGLNVRGSEALGMSQRGGAVVGHLRIGSAVYGPLVPDGKGDVLVGFEPSETLRNVTYLSKDGLIIVNTRPIVPHMVSIGLSVYPSTDEILGKLEQYARVVAFNATELAEKAGGVIAVNTVMIGALAGSGRLPIKSELILKAIERCVPKGTVAMNQKAFELGYDEILKALPRF